MLKYAKNYGELVKAYENIRETVQETHNSIPENLVPAWVVLGPGTIDQPGMFLARLHLLASKGATNMLVRAGSLEAIRSLLPEGLICIPRDKDDDPNIIETWL